ncbi:hypothetical protein P261_02282 [Lachnospiraceae bacterium TWA4]|nr:hypothetical protein P261_02282 [Lachnospiraceae bacterium TWA4]
MRERVKSLAFIKIKNAEEFEFPSGAIDDTHVSDETTWSSQRIQAELSKKSNTTTTQTTTFMSGKTATFKVEEYADGETKTIKFPKEFSKVPCLFITSVRTAVGGYGAPEWCDINVISVTKSDFTVSINNEKDVAFNVVIHYLATL